jgi:hypothetical protein
MPLSESSFVDAARYAMQAKMTSLLLLKELYADWGPQYYEVEGAHEELLRLIKELAPVEKALYGISEDGENINE